MMLSSSEILKRLHRADGLTISPFEARNVQPASVDLRLGSEMRMICDSVISPGDSTPVRTWEVALESYLLMPGDFLLAHTLETVTLPHDLSAQLAGKSSLGRCGLVVHATAGFIDPGFSGQITLELSNVGPAAIRLRQTMLIAQIIFTRLSEPCLFPYGSPEMRSHYQNQKGATGPDFTPMGGIYHGDRPA